MRDVKSGTFKTMIVNLLKNTRNNYGFGVTWNLEVTVEGVPEEASDDAVLAQISADNEEDASRQHSVEE